LHSCPIIITIIIITIILGLDHTNRKKFVYPFIGYWAPRLIPQLSDGETVNSPVINVGMEVSLLYVDLHLQIYAPEYYSRVLIGIFLVF
jgi:hypothetical protein